MAEKPLTTVAVGGGERAYSTAEIAGNEVAFRVTPTFDLSQFTLSASFDIDAETDAPNALAWNNSGDRFFILDYPFDSGSGGVDEYHLTTPFDVTTATYDSTFSLGNIGELPHALSFNNSGDRMYIAVDDGFSRNVREYTLSAAFDITTASYNNVSKNIAPELLSPSGMDWNPDGSEMTIAGEGREFYTYQLSTAFDLSTASYNGDSFFGNEGTNIGGFSFGADGEMMFTTTRTADDVFQYNLSTPYDITSASFSGETFDISGEAIFSNDISFNDDMSSMFIVDLDTEVVYEYTL